MVDTVMPGLTRLLLIAIVAFEQSNGLLVAYAHHNLTFLTVFTACAVGTQQVDVVLGIGDAHRTRFRRHPWESAEGHGSLCLSEAFHHLNAGLFLELVEDSRIQCLAGGTTVFQ